MKALKAIKKIAAAGLGFAFIGATIGGAMATDLGDYPAPFATGSGYNGKIIVGEKASAIDIVGAVNIASSFTNLEGAGSVIVETPEGKVVNAVAFDELDEDGEDLDDDEMPMKGDTRILKFEDDDPEWAFMQGYENDDITEDLFINITATEKNSECDNDEPAISVDSFVYNFTDESDDLEDEIEDFEDDVEEDDSADFEYQITLFGKEYLVVGDDVDELSSGNLKLQLANADETVQAGDEIDLAPYGYNGYTLKITRIVESASSESDSGTVFVALMKDGVQIDDETIDEGVTRTLEDEDEEIEIDMEVSNVYWDASESEYYAEISFEAGEITPDDYFDENEIWELTQLEIADDTLTIGVSFNPSHDDIDCELESGNLFVGNTLTLQGYLELGFTGLTQPSTGKVEIYREDDDADEDGADETVIVISTGDNVYVETEDFDGKGVEAKFYLDGTDWKLYEFGDEDDDDVLDADNVLRNVKIYIEDDYEYVLDANETALNITEPTDLVDNVLTISDINESSWDEDIVSVSGSDSEILKIGDTTDLGTELYAYDQYGREREVTFTIVSDAVRYQVYAGQSVQSEGNEVELEVGDTAPAGAKVVAVGAKPLPVGLAILDSELSSPDAVKDDNYIVVGGPCANSAAAALMGIEDPTTCDVAFADEGYSAGEAVIKLYEDDGNFQLLVAGYNGEDTLLATEVLASYDEFKDEFEGEKEVKVKGTALADVEIES